MEPQNFLHVSSLMALPQSLRDEIISNLSKAKQAKLLHSWEAWARKEQLPPEEPWTKWLFLAGRGSGKTREQLPPEEPWTKWLFLAGRGSGKTRSGAEWIRNRVKLGYMHIGLVAPTAADSRDVMVEGPSGIMNVCWEYDRDLKGNPLGRPLYEPSKRRVTRGLMARWQQRSVLKNLTGYAVRSTTPYGATSWPRGPTRRRGTI